MLVGQATLLVPDGARKCDEIVIDSRRLTASKRPISVAAVTKSVTETADPASPRRKSGDYRTWSNMNLTKAIPTGRSRTIRVV